MITRTQFLLSRVLMLLLIFFHQAITAQASSLNVPDLNENSFVDLFSSEKPSVVLFQSQEIDAKLLANFSQLPQLLDSTSLEVNLGVYNVEESNPLPLGFNVKAFPAIKLIIEGKVFDYGGEKTAVDLIHHLRTLLYSTVLTITEPKKLDILYSTQRTLLVYFTSSFSSSSSDRTAEIKAVLGDLIKKWGGLVRFVIARDINEIKSLNGFQVNKDEIVLLRPHRSPYISYQGVIDSQLISGFLLENVFSRITEMNQDLVNLLKEEKIVSMLLVIKKEDSGLEEELLKASKDIGNDLLLTVYWDNSNQVTDSILQDLIGSGAPFKKSQLFIMDYCTGRLKYYRMDQAVTVENIKQYYQYWVEKKITPLLRSEMIPERSDDPLTKIVGRNFMQKVMDPDNDVYVVFHFDGCGDTCTKLIGMVEGLASHMSQLRLVKFYKINLSLNNIPDLELTYIPAFGGYIRGNKDLQLYTEEKVSYDKLLDFVNEKSKFLTKEQYDDLKKEAEVSYLDSLMANANKEQKEPERFVDIEL